MILRLILGDQLNPNHSWFEEVNKDVCYVLIESAAETGYVRHHIQKIAAFFIAMRRFSDHLEDAGNKVEYLKLDDERSKSTISETLKFLSEEWDVDEIQYQMPDEYRLDQELLSLEDEVDIPVTSVDSEHFLTSRTDLEKHFEGKKTYVMESFYRMMRRKYNIMLDEDGNPEGGEWNYDQKNRKKYKGKPAVPEDLSFNHSASKINELLESQNVETIGEKSSTSDWPADADEAEQVLEHFLKEALPWFGTYQDAMHTDYETLFHSRISFALNTKMIDPLTVVEKSIAYWRAHQEEIEINQIEGFVRQILGWREFMRGIYWAKMPEYAALNHFNHKRKLPEWYWTGDTKMNCLHHAIKQSLETSYAHHIQRLMITGNFALLAGIDPDEVDAWYLGIYIDAIEWVEITNTRGMSQFADGGIVGTKPYISSANYIDKMSNYCSDCHYAKTKKTGEKACPFNSLYWQFYHRHADTMKNNHRVAMMYRTWDRMGDEKQKALIDQAEYYLDHIEKL
jgi:deoxyribodipyrimidine photolyase-related protein